VSETFAKTFYRGITIDRAYNIEEVNRYSVANNLELVSIACSTFYTIAIFKPLHKHRGEL
jgi:hypothetical protein